MSLKLLNEKLKTQSQKHRPKILGFISIIISLGMVFAGGITMLNLKQIDISKEQRIEKTTENYWKFVSGILFENLDKANIQASFLRNNIQQSILDEYSNNMEQLKTDIDNPTADSRLSKIFNKYLDNVYLNYKSDNNDLFVVSLHNPSKIIYNKSINSSKNTKTQSWADEKTIHYNKILFNDASNKIINQNTERPIFYEMLKSNDNNHYVIKNSNIKELKKVFYSEGIEGMKTYTFLNPQYITDKGTDIFGKEDVSSTGQFNNNYKLAIVQEFNLYDELLLKYKDKVEWYKNELTTIENESNSQKLTVQLEAFSVSIVLLIIIVAITAIQNTILEEEQKRDEVINEAIDKK